MVGAIPNLVCVCVSSNSKVCLGSNLQSSKGASAVVHTATWPANFGIFSSVGEGSHSTRCFSQTLDVSVAINCFSKHLLRSIYHFSTLTPTHLTRSSSLMYQALFPNGISRSGCPSMECLA